MVILDHKISYCRGGFKIPVTSEMELFKCHKEFFILNVAQVPDPGSAHNTVPWRFYAYCVFVDDVETTWFTLQINYVTPNNIWKMKLKWNTGSKSIYVRQMW